MTKITRSLTPDQLIGRVLIVAGLTILVSITILILFATLSKIGFIIIGALFVIFPFTVWFILRPVFNHYRMI